MMATTKSKYTQPTSRQQEKEAARRKIIETAYRLFRDEGYIATPLVKIAQEADVPLATITSQFGTKFMLLDTLAKVYTRGDDSPTAISSRTWWQAILQEPDAATQVRAYVKTIRIVHERTMGIAEIIGKAAAADVEIAAMRKILQDGRWDDVRSVAVSLSAKDALLPDLSIDKASDILWTLGAGDTYRMMVVERHWSGDDYQMWLSNTLIASLLRRR